MKINLLVGGPIENYPERLLENRDQDELWVGADKERSDFAKPESDRFFQSETSIHQRIANDIW